MVANAIADRASLESVARAIADAFVTELGASSARVWVVAENGACSELVAEAGARSGGARVILPLGDGVAVAWFSSPAPRELDALSAIGAAAVRHVRALAASDRRRRRAEDAERFLVEASGLLGSSLDYEATLAQVAELAKLADGCVIDIVDEHGALRRVAAVDADPAKQPLMARMKALPPPAPDAPVHRVLVAPQPLVSPTVDREQLLANARNAEHAEIMLALAPRSSVVAPLRVRGKAIGIVWLYFSRSSRVYDEDARTVVSELADRIALAVENARLYQNAQNAVRFRPPRRRRSSRSPSARSIG